MLQWLTWKNFFKNTYVLGILLGLIMPIAGVFFGLQVSGVLGTIFAFPVVVMVIISGLPLGMWSTPIWVAAFGLSVAIWIGVVVLGKKFLR